MFVEAPPPVKAKTSSARLLFIICGTQTKIIQKTTTKSYAQCDVKTRKMQMKEKYIRHPQPEKKERENII